MKKITKNNASNLIKISTGVSLFFLPLLTFAADITLKSIIEGTVMDYLKVAVYLIISLAVVTFVWNVYRYYFTEKDKTEAGKYVLFSIIGFFVILSLWGLVAILQNSFALPANSRPWPFGPASGSAGGLSNPPGGVFGPPQGPVQDPFAPVDSGD